MALEFNLKQLQDVTNEIYQDLGPTQEVIELQAAINALRNKYDIVDKTEEMNKEGFVQ